MVATFFVVCWPFYFTCSHLCPFLNLNGRFIWCIFCLILVILSSFFPRLTITFPRENRYPGKITCWRSRATLRSFLINLVSNGTILWSMCCRSTALRSIRSAWMPLMLRTIEHMAQKWQRSLHLWESVEEYWKSYEPFKDLVINSR